MSDKTPENDAVNQAEEIISSSLAKLGREECVEGKDCPIHFRLDADEMNDYVEWGRLVNYVGEYAVITTDNPDLESPAVLLRLILGLYNTAPPKFETCVLYVGEGSVGDLYEGTEEDRVTALRYVHKHTEWDAFRSEHENVVFGVEHNLFDLSTPLKGN